MTKTHTIIMRPITMKDITSIQKLPLSHGSAYRLRGSKPELRQLVKHSEDTFAGIRNTALWFVLELNGSLIGTCGIKTSCPSFIAYQKNNNIIRKVEVETGFSEFMGMFAIPQARGLGFGKLAVIARLVFADSKPHITGNRFSAQIRGCYDSKGNSPWWLGAVGPHLPRPLQKLSYSELVKILREGHEQEILRHLPDVLHFTQITKQAQEVVGKPHPEAQPQLNLLLRHGFQWDSLLEYSCGSPIITRPLEGSIKRMSKTYVALNNRPPTATNLRILTGEGRYGFTATMGRFTESNGVVHLSRNLAAALGWNDGTQLNSVAFPGSLEQLRDFYHHGVCSLL